MKESSRSLKSSQAVQLAVVRSFNSYQEDPRSLASGGCLAEKASTSTRGMLRAYANTATMSMQSADLSSALNAVVLHFKETSVA